MGRKFQVCALSLVAAFGYTTSAFAQAPAPAADISKPADPTAAAGTTEPAPVAAPPTDPAAAPAPPAPAPPPPATTAAEVPQEPPPTTFDPLKIESKNATLKIGLLLQPQYEAISAGTSVSGVTAGEDTHKGMSNNLFIRRTRLLVGGSLFKTFEYFFDTDVPNLFKGDQNVVGGMTPSNGTGVKGGTNLIVQDAFGTWKAAEDAFKVDIGYMLTPGAHNALQGAGTLYGLDYFSNTFIHNTLLNVPAAALPAGRDVGMQFRGLVLDNHLEYRVGIFQGKRNAGTADHVAGSNMFRIAGRVQVNLLDAETGFFYAGSYLGKKKVLSLGGAYDFQSDYKHWAVDAFLDMPAGPGGITAQVNVGGWKGGDFTTPALPNAVMAIMAEAGYRLDAFPISPIVKFENLSQSDTDFKQMRVGGGLAYWPYGHTINVKAFYTHSSTQFAADTDKVGQDQFQLQTQLYFY
ncbi:MAG TPA: hypothetical protein VER11_06105 [Polyangiaceae bacterium]|nr:hypothetical protein [Polyangiaceae bacterium]